MGSEALNVFEVMEPFGSNALNGQFPETRFKVASYFVTQMIKHNNKKKHK